MNPDNIKKLFFSPNKEDNLIAMEMLKSFSFEETADLLCKEKPRGYRAPIQVYYSPKSWLIKSGVMQFRSFVVNKDLTIHFYDNCCFLYTKKQNHITQYEIL